MAEITEKSLVSVGLVLAIIATVFWVGVRDNQVSANTRDIVDLKTAAVKDRENYVSILVGITEIKSQLQKLKK